MKMKMMTLTMTSVSSFSRRDAARDDARHDDEASQDTPRRALRAPRSRAWLSRVAETRQCVTHALVIHRIMTSPSTSIASDIARALDALEHDVRRVQEMRAEVGFRAHARRTGAIDDDDGDDSLRVGLTTFTARARAHARATRAQILDARSAWFVDGARGKAQALERCAALEELIEPPQRAPQRATPTPTPTPSTPAWGDVFGAITHAVRKLTVTRERGEGEDAGRGEAIGKLRYTREQREREAASSISASASRRDDGGDGRHDVDGNRDDGFVGKATWYEGAAESLARVGAGVGGAMTSTSTSTSKAAVDARVDADAERRALLSSASSTASASASGKPSTAPEAPVLSSNAEERARRVSALTAASRLDATSDTLAQCKTTLDDVNDIGAGVLATLASQRESLIRAGGAARRAQRDMDENLKTIKGMNSWTRLGRKP